MQLLQLIAWLTRGPPKPHILRSPCQDLQSRVLISFYVILLVLNCAAYYSWTNHFLRLFAGYCLFAMLFNYLCTDIHESISWRRKSAGTPTTLCQPPQTKSPLYCRLISPLVITHFSATSTNTTSGPTTITSALKSCCLLSASCCFLLFVDQCVQLLVASFRVPQILCS
jgi:hypothetical protein